MLAIKHFCLERPRAVQALQACPAHHVSCARIGSLAGLALALVLAGQAPVSYAAGDIVAGKATFAQCASCHAVGPSARAGFGPQLNGLFGRPAAATPDYKYSAAMKNSGIVWSEKTLTAFLKAPSDVVPGTKMRFYGISDDKKIANLLAYLHTMQ
ncbi:MAG: cytochrome c family protein [Massilia sp.]|nr:cytochrome c family protein [Massilia sp.]